MAVGEPLGEGGVLGRSLEPRVICESSAERTNFLVVELVAPAQLIGDP